MQRAVLTVRFGDAVVRAAVASVIVSWAALSTAGPSVAADIQVFASGAPAAVQKQFAPAFTAATGHKVVITAATLNDIRKQLSGLIRTGFVAGTGWWLLPHLQRYLKAIDHRLDKLPANVQRDRDYTHRIEEIQQEYADAVAQLPPARRAADAVQQIPWMIEELRVSYFAQAMGTAYAVSDVRIYRAIDAL